MHNVKTKQWLKGGAATFVLGLSILTGNIASAATNSDDMMGKSNPVLDRAVMAALEQCQRVSSSCADSTNNAEGILVFPKVVKADLVIGGEGGKGALIEHGKITGYYNIGAASAGLQAGIEKASQVYVFRTADALAKLKEGPDWKAGATAGVTLVTADANATSVTGDVLAYVFNSKGLNAGVSLDALDVWESGQARPSES